MMPNNRKSQNFLYKALLYLVVFFALIVILGSAAIKITLGSLILAIIFPFKPLGSFLSTYNASMLFYIIVFYSNYIKKIR
jgi:hypothetical protein